MKINIEIDATPEEARTFLGLPDLQPLQRELLEKIRENMLAGVSGVEALKLFSQIWPEQMNTIEAIKNAFWGGLQTKQSSGEADGSAKKTK